MLTTRVLILLTCVVLVLGVLFFLFLCLLLIIVILTALVFLLLIAFNAAAVYALYTQSLKKGVLLLVAVGTGLLFGLAAALGFYILNAVMHYTTATAALFTGAVMGFLSGTLGIYLVYRLFKKMVQRQQVKKSASTAKN